MKNSSTLFATLSLALLVFGAPAAALAVPVNNASTQLTFSPISPISTDGGSATDVRLIANTTSADAAIAAVIDQGKVTFQYATRLGCVSTAAAADNWVSLTPNNLEPSAGTTNQDVDIDALPCFLPGAVIGFRAHYVTGGGQLHADTHFSPAVDLATTQINAACSGLNIASSLAEGNGAPLPGTNGSWKFRITVKNCTGAPLTGVKVQGGASGWTTFITATPSDGGSATWDAKNKNTVITWFTNLADGAEKSIDVVVNGSIKGNATCSPDPNAPVPGSVLYLSGSWSALSGSYKPYSERVSIVVSCAP